MTRGSFLFLLAILIPFVLAEGTQYVHDAVLPTLFGLVVIAGLAWCLFLLSERTDWLPFRWKGFGRDPLGILDIYGSRKQADAALVDALQQAHRHVTLLGFDFRNSFSKKPMQEALSRFLAQPQARLDLFYSDPNSAAHGTRAKLESRSPEAQANRTRRAMIEHLELFEDWGLDQRVRFHVHPYGATWRIWGVDLRLEAERGVIFLSTYDDPQVDEEKPLIYRLAPGRQRGSLFAVASQIFRTCSEASQEYRPKGEHRDDQAHQKQARFE